MINFIFGLMLGFLAGFVATAMLLSNKIDDLQNEVDQFNLIAKEFRSHADAE